MRVALVSEHASPLAALGGADAGGQNVHVAALAAALADLGATVDVYTRRDDGGLPPSVDVVPGVTVHHVAAGPARPLPKDHLVPYLPALTRGLEEAWSLRRPDVVHAHFWMSGICALNAAPGAVPVLQTYHALGTVKRRHQGHADTSPRCRLAAECRIADEAAHIIATSSDEVFELRRMGAESRSISVIPCGVDLDRFTPDGPAEQRSGRPRIVCVSRFVERKGLDDVVRALPLLPDYELVIAGGPARDQLDRDPVARGLRAVAEAEGVADRLSLRGSIGRDAVPALLRSADVVCCTPWYEPFGIVPLETMACGVPVVATAVGGLIDTVVHGVTGLHVPPRRPDAIADAVASIADRPELRDELGAAGRARAEARYGWPRIGAASLDIYRAVLRESVDTAEAYA
jgi:glycosyltransferase involved in cell wall biosynthesis